MTASARSAAATLAVLLAALLAGLTGALLSTVVLAAPASAAEQVVRITADGVVPQQLTVRAGDTLTFVNEDTGFRYAPRSTGGKWDFAYETSLLNPALGPGERYTVPRKGSDEPFVFADSGTYSYTVLEQETPDTAAYRGTVVLPAPRGAVTPASPAPRPASSPASSPSPAATGGSGTAAAPPLTGGFGSGGQPAPAPTGGDGVALPPALAPPLVGEAPAGSGPVPSAAPAPPTARLAAPAVPGELAGARSTRSLGLPAALAVVLAAGTASLLVRLLLAEPAARRPRTVGPVATLD